ncbi:MAG: FtsX-like permease family protein [Fibrobacterota bacterium]
MEWFIALRYLRGKRKMGFISLITYISAAGVFLGSMVLVIALAIANGFEKEVRDRIVGSTAHARILKYHKRPITQVDSIRQRIEEHPQVVSTAPYISAKGMVEYDDVQEGVMITAIQDDADQPVTDLKEKIKFGEFSFDSTVSNRERKQTGIVIGIGLADRLGIRPGAEIVLGTVVTTEAQLDPVPVMGRYVVTGVFETGMYEYDLNFVYMGVDAAQRLLNMNGVEGIQIRTKDLFNADKIATSVKEKLGGYPFRATDWKSQNQSLFKWMKLEKLIIFIVISMIIVVAAFNIVSSLIMMILEKRREIGLLMGMGATRHSVMRIFMFNGTIIGFIGSSAGVLIGVLIAWIQYRWRIIPLPGDVYFIDAVPMLIRPLDVLAIYVASNIICILAASFPAWRASKILPAESIRYE